MMREGKDEGVLGLDHLALTERIGCCGEDPVPRGAQIENERSLHLARIARIGCFGEDPCYLEW